MRKKPQMGQAKAALKAFDDQYKGKTLTETQEKQRAALVETMKAEQFKKSANKNAHTAIKAIERIGKLAKLPHTADQVGKLRDAFSKALSAAFERFDKRSADKEQKTIEIV